MRFLIGILTGAVVTLLVATAMDAPTHPLLNNARDLAANGWDRLINATSDSLFDSAQDLETAPADRPAEAGATPTSEAPSAALQPATALDAPEPVAPSPSSEFWAVSALTADAQANANQPVWVPFHSQMSAQGFASRLSRSLDHEFRVVRQGAGTYQVVFDAADADQRALILAQVTEITGQ